MYMSTPSFLDIFVIEYHTPRAKIDLISSSGKEEENIETIFGMQLLDHCHHGMPQMT